MLLIILKSSCYLLLSYPGFGFELFIAVLLDLLCWLRIYVSFLFNFSALWIFRSNYSQFIILFMLFIIEIAKYKIYNPIINSYQQHQSNNNRMQTQKTVLITVGTTHFQSLIKTTDTDDFVNMFKKHGYTKIIYQIGKGHYIPTHGEHFRLTPHINQYYSKADLIITHGGAGTLLQNLLSQKLMIAVANQQLLGNHQIELIEKLANEEYIIGFASIKQLQEGMAKIQKFITSGNRKIYKRPNNCIMNQLVFGKDKDS